MYRFFTVVLLSCSLLLPVYAAEKQEEIPADPWAFELSVQPKKTEAELEAERWTLLMSSETGNYLFEYTEIEPRLFRLKGNVIKEANMLAKSDEYWYFCFED